MPTYQYRCTECDHAFEQFQSFTDDALTVCPVCGGRLRKVFNAVGVVFKGSGFYRNDSRGHELLRDRPARRPRRRRAPASARLLVGSSDVVGSTSELGLVELVRLVVLVVLGVVLVVLVVVEHGRSAASTAGTATASRGLWRGPRGPPPARLPSGDASAPTDPSPPATAAPASAAPYAGPCWPAAVRWPRVRGGRGLAGVHAARPRGRPDRRGDAWPPTTSPPARSSAATTWSCAATRPASLPPGSEPEAVGRTLAAPVREGEPVTDVRLVAPSLVAGYPGPGRAAGADRRRGRRRRCCGSATASTCVAADPRRGTASYVAVDVPVLALPAPADRRHRSRPG